LPRAGVEGVEGTVDGVQAAAGPRRCRAGAAPGARPAPSGERALSMWAPPGPAADA